MHEVLKVALTKPLPKEEKEHSKSQKVKHEGSLHIPQAV